jgi:serine/threonine protein kinase
VYVAGVDHEADWRIHRSCLAETPLMNEPTEPVFPPDPADAPPSGSTGGWTGPTDPASSAGAAPAWLREGGEPVAGYRLLRRLGRGGFGEVWEAAGPGEVCVALKLLPLSPAGEVEMRAVDVIKNIRHPHLLFLFGIWQRDGWLIIGMEKAEGSLAERLRQQRSSGRSGLAAEELGRYLRETADVLDFLNKPRHFLGGPQPVGLQHGDIKPQNLLLLSRHVKVADFGLVRVLDRARAVSGLTPAYAAPEVFAGRASRWSDQYALAVAYCELRGGRLPFTGRSRDDLACAHASQPPDLDMLPPAERNVVARALAKQPRERWGNCRQFVKELLAVQKGGDEGPIRAGPRPRSGRRLALLVLGTILLCVAGLCLSSTIVLRMKSIFFVPISKNKAVPPGTTKPTVWSGRSRQWVAVPVTAALLVLVGAVLLYLRRRRSRAAASAVALTLGRGPRSPGHHEDAVWGVAVAPDGRTALSAGMDGTIRLWEVQADESALDRDVRELRRLGGEAVGAASAAFSPDGQQIASAWLDGRVRLWQAGSGEELLRLEGHSGRALAVAFSGDGRRLLSAGEDAVIRVWDVPSGLPAGRLEGHTGWVHALAVAPDGATLVSTTAGGEVRLWDLGSLQERASWRQSSAAIRCVAFAPDGETFITGSDDGRLTVWETATLRQRQQFAGHRDWVRTVAVHPDGDRFLSGGDDETVRLWKRSALGQWSLQGERSFAGESILAAAVSRQVWLHGTDSGRVFVELTGRE